MKADLIKRFTETDRTYLDDIDRLEREISDLKN